MGNIHILKTKTISVGVEKGIQQDYNVYYCYIRDIEGNVYTRSMPVLYYFEGKFEKMSTVKYPKRMEGVPFVFFEMCSTSDRDFCDGCRVEFYKTGGLLMSSNSFASYRGDNFAPFKKEREG